MTEKIHGNAARENHAELRNLAMQLAVQLSAHSRQEQHEIVDLMHVLIEWEHAEVQRFPDLKVVG
jgi:hypothetical protein